MIRFLTSVPFFLAGALLAVYGLFALTFNEPGGGYTYVTLAGHRLNAHLVGGASLVVGLGLLAAAVAVARRGSLRS